MGGGAAQDRYDAGESHLALVVEAAVGGGVAGGCRFLMGLGYKVGELLAAQLSLLYRLEDTRHVNRVQAEVGGSGPLCLLGLVRQLALLKEMIVLHSGCLELLVV